MRSQPRLALEVRGENPRSDGTVLPRVRLLALLLFALYRGLELAF